MKLSAKQAEILRLAHKPGRLLVETHDNGESAGKRWSCLIAQGDNPVRIDRRSAQALVRKGLVCIAPPTYQMISTPEPIPMGLVVPTAAGRDALKERDHDGG